jgi:hypothetical protein
MAVKNLVPNLLQPQAAQHTPRPVTSALFVLRSDLKTATTDVDDPTALAIDLAAVSPAANSLLHRVIKNPGAYFLDLFQMVSGATLTVTQAVKIRAFGFIPFADANNEDHPYARDATNFTSPDNATLVNPGLDIYANTKVNQKGLWVPLRRPTDGAHELTFSTTLEVQKDSTASSSVAHALGDNAPDATPAAQPAYVSCGGCTHILALVSQAMTGPSGACLLGAFRS